MWREPQRLHMLIWAATSMKCRLYRIFWVCVVQWYARILICYKKLRTNNHQTFVCYMWWALRQLRPLCIGFTAQPASADKYTESGKAVSIATQCPLQRESYPEPSGVLAVPEDGNGVFSTSPSSSLLFLNVFQILPRRPISGWVSVITMTQKCHLSWNLMLQPDFGNGI